jgi:hypothetical protein
MAGFKAMRSVSWDLGKVPVFALHRASRPRAASPPLQPKLVIGAVNDPLEHEADRAAEAVLADAPAPASSPAPGLVQRKCAACEAEEEETARRAVENGSARQSGRECCASAPDAVAAAVAGGGAPLPADLRSYFEPRFGHDLARVRVHNDAAAGAAARSIDARAFTLGAEIAFAPGEYAPGTQKGRRLLAHELAHVVQQAGTPAAFRVMRQTHPGCDRATTGVADADQQIDDASLDAIVLAGDAQRLFPRMDSATIKMADRHFHCPSGGDQIDAIRAHFGTIRSTIFSLEPRCSRASASLCRRGFVAQVSSDGALELCPSAFDTGTASGTLTGIFIWAGAINAGSKRICDWGTNCYDDFTVPASDRIKHAGPYEGFALELRGYISDLPETVPCRPRNTHESVVVPPDAASDPSLIRPPTGYDPSPPPGSRVVPVWEDSDGQRFIYSESLPGAKAYLPNEGKRFYLPSRLRYSP